MSFNPELAIGTKIDNKTLREIFKCSPQGGMRRSNRTNTLCLISDHTKSLYDDKWIDGVMHYTGMGSNGDQSLEYMQNKTLYKAKEWGVDVFLFEVFESGVYTFMGEVELRNPPYQERQLDTEGRQRLVWMFPLFPVGEEFPVVEYESLQKKETTITKKAKKLDDTKLLKRAKSAKGKAGSRIVTASTYERDPYVAELALRQAAGRCQLCGQSAPFNKNNGDPYLEVHHIVWLSRGGDDSIENTVALCPNCHRKMHVLNNDEDISFLKRAKG
jgi:5-methylcytosine-specific restriction protein A